MIDSLVTRGKIKKGQIPNLDKLSRPYLQSEVGTGKTSRTRYRNLWVDIDYEHGRPKEMSVIGSPTKFHFGNNVLNFSLRDFKRSVKSVSKDLGIDYLEFDVNSIEVGANVVVNHPPEMYCIGLISHSHRKMKRSVIRDYETVLFANRTNKEMIFYNKSLEARKFLPSWLQGINILRYEYKIKNKVLEFMKLESLKVKDLCTRSVWNKLIKVWYSEYRKINRMGNLIITGNLTVPRLRNHLVIKAINLIGPNKIQGMIESHIRDKKLKGNKASRLIHWISNLMDDPEYTVRSFLFREFDTKIELIAISSMKFL